MWQWCFLCFLWKFCAENQGAAVKIDLLAHVPLLLASGVRRDTYTMFAGSLRPFTHCPACHFSFLLLSNFVFTCLKPACVGRISHQGASKQCIREKCYLRPLTLCLYTTFINGCRIDILSFEFKLASLASLEIMPSFEFWTGERGQKG